MASVQETIDRLTQAWIGEGRALPILYPMEPVEIMQFAKRNGISKEEMLEAFRELVEQGERATLAAGDWSRVPRV